MMARTKSKRRPRRKTNGTRTRRAKALTIRFKKVRLEKLERWL